MAILESMTLFNLFLYFLLIVAVTRNISVTSSGLKIYVQLFKVIIPLVHPHGIHSLKQLTSKMPQ